MRFGVNYYNRLVCGDATSTEKYFLSPVPSLDKMRILVVCEPGTGGAFRHVESLLKHLLAVRLSVGFAFSSKRGSAPQEKIVQLVKDSGGAALDLLVSNAPTPADLIAFCKFLQFSRQFRPDIVHCHSSKAGILGRLAGVLIGVPSVYTPHAYYGMGTRSGFPTLFFSQLEQLFGGCCHTVNVSEDEAAFAREHLGIRQTRQSVILNAVDTKVFKPATIEEKKRWRLAKGLPADALILGTLGRLSYQKDPLTLYRAFATVARNHPIAYLAHLGTGELAGECEEWIQSSGLRERIVRMDYLQDPSDFYRSLDGFVLSSRYEGLSIAVLEALATDLPLVLTDVPGNRDFLRLGLSHVWGAPAEDPDALAAAMESCLLDLENRRASNHRAVALERFSEEVCFGKTLDLYREIVESRRKQHSLASSA